MCCADLCHFGEAVTVSLAGALTITMFTQVIKEKGLQKLPGRSVQDDVDDQEGALIWKIHEQVPEELKSAVYKVRSSVAHSLWTVVHCYCLSVADATQSLEETTPNCDAPSMLEFPECHRGRQQHDSALTLLLFMLQKLLPHRTLGEIRDWRNANLKKRKATEKPRQKPQPPPEKLTTKGSGTFVRRPSLQQKHSATKCLQLVPSDDLFQDSLWGSSAEPQKSKAKPAADAKDLAAYPGKLTARKSSSTQQQQSMPSTQQAAAKKLQQPGQQVQRSGSDALPNSIVREVSKAAAAFRKQSTQAISREASPNESEAGTGPASETAPPQSASLGSQALSSPLLLQRHLRLQEDLRKQIPDWSLDEQRPRIKAEDSDRPVQPALPSRADLVNGQPVTTAQPSHQQQKFTQQQGALSEVEILGQSANRKRQRDASEQLASEGLQKAEALQQQSAGFGGHVLPAAEPTHISDMDTEPEGDPLFDHYEAMQQDSAAETLPASTLHRAACAKPEEATQPHSAPGWTHQAVSQPMPALVGAYPVVQCLLNPIQSFLPWREPVASRSSTSGCTMRAALSLSYSQACCEELQKRSQGPHT